jgi:hypothetical protein
MRRLMKATGYGLKHFFGARETKNQLEAFAEDYKQINRDEKSFARVIPGYKPRKNRVRKAKVLALAGMYLVYKGSPIALGKNIKDSIKMGKWKYADIKKHEADLRELLATTNMSEAGQRQVISLLATGTVDASADLSPADAAILQQLENELHIAAGHCINF